MYIREKIENQIKALIAGSVDAAMEAGDFSARALPEDVYKRQVYY